MHVKRAAALCNVTGISEGESCFHSPRESDNKQRGRRGDPATALAGEQRAWTLLRQPLTPMPSPPSAPMAFWELIVLKHRRMYVCTYQANGPRTALYDMAK